MSTSKQRDQAAKGPAPKYVEPPARGERCPRCHVTDNSQRCALCNPGPPRPADSRTQIGVLLRLGTNIIRRIVWTRDEEEINEGLRELRALRWALRDLKIGSRELFGPPSLQAGSIPWYRWPRVRAHVSLEHYADLFRDHKGARIQRARELQRRKGGPRDPARKGGRR